jgi:hypothetical protein
MSESVCALCPGLTCSGTKGQWRDRLLRLFLSYGLVLPQCSSWTPEGLPSASEQKPRQAIDERIR